MKKLVSLILLTLFALSIHAQPQDQVPTTPEDFQALLKKCGLKLTVPDNFEETPFKQNPDQYYHYAIKHQKSPNTEIRYCIRAYSEQDIEFNKEMPNLKEVQFMTIVMNMTHGARNDFEEFHPEAVKEEFGADWGATTAVKQDCAFGEGYEFISINAFHKTDVADVYVFYLTDDIKAMMELMGDMSTNWFYTLRFE